MTLKDLQFLAITSLRDPARAFAMLRSLDLPMSARWMALGLLAVTSALISWLTQRSFPIAPNDPLAPFLLQPPIIRAVVQFVVLALTAALMAGVGRMFGGKGDFPDALLVVVWTEILLLVVQAVQLLMLFVSPFAAALLTVVATALFFWLTVQFTKALHGFDSTPKVILGLIATIFIAGAVLFMIAAAFGLLPEVPQA